MGPRTQGSLDVKGETVCSSCYLLNFSKRAVLSLCWFGPEWGTGLSCDGVDGVGGVGSGGDGGGCGGGDGGGDGGGGGCW